MLLSVFRPAVLPDDAHIKAFPLSVIVIVVSNVCKEFVKSPDLVSVGRLLQPTCSNRRMRWSSTSISSKNILAGEEKGLNLLTRVYRYSWSYPFIFLMRRVRVLGIGSDDKPLLQHRREVISIEVNPALDPDRRAKR